MNQTSKVIAVEIVITPAEGLHAGEECTFNHGDIWTAANIYLSRLRDDASTLGYDKTDFSVRYEDGYVYKGRYDVERTELAPTLARHISEHCRFHAGLANPTHITTEEYQRYLSDTVGDDRDDYADFLDRYEIGLRNATY